MDDKQRVLVGAIQKFSTEDGPGIRTTVFLKGCPLHCRWCHNPELIGYEQQLIRMPNNCIHCGYCLTHCPQEALYIDADERINIDRSRCDCCLKCTKFCYANALQAVAKPMTVPEIFYEVVKDKGFYDATNGGMTISGGEMLSHAPFVFELLEAAYQEGIGVCLDTCGYGDTDDLVKLGRHVAVTNILYDIKSINDKIHIKYTGHSNALILQNLKCLALDPIIHDKLIMRMPLIGGVNDTLTIIKETAALYREFHLYSVTLLPYHDLGVSKSLNIGNVAEHFSSPSKVRIEEIREIFETTAKMTVTVLGS